MKLQCPLMTLHQPKLLLIGLMERISTANPSKYHSPPAELSSHRGVVVVVAAAAEGGEEVSEVVVVVDPTLTLKEETGLVPTALAAT